jgi:hypothetical protein
MLTLSGWPSPFRHRRKCGDESEEAAHSLTAGSIPNGCRPRTRHLWGTRQSRWASGGFAETAFLCWLSLRERSIRGQIHLRPVLGRSVCAGDPGRELQPRPCKGVGALFCAPRGAAVWFILVRGAPARRSGASKRATNRGVITASLMRRPREPLIMTVFVTPLSFTRQLGTRHTGQLSRSPHRATSRSAELAAIRRILKCRPSCESHSTVAHRKVK